MLVIIGDLWLDLTIKTATAVATGQTLLMLLLSGLLLRLHLSRLPLSPSKIVEILFKLLLRCMGQSYRTHWWIFSEYICCSYLPLVMLFFSLLLVHLRVLENCCGRLWLIHISGSKSSGVYWRYNGSCKPRGLSGYGQVRYSIQRMTQLSLPRCPRSYTERVFGPGLV